MTLHRIIVLFLVIVSVGPMVSHAQGDTLRVLTYNIHHGEGTDGQVDLKRVARVIRAQHPDVVLLQEVDSSTTRTGQVNQARRLAALTDLPHYAFGRFMNYQGGAYGMAILSAHPIEAHTNHRLPEGPEPRSTLIARIRPAQGRPPLEVANVHLYRSEAERLAQAKRVIALLADEKGPAILGGDFNSTPDGPVMRRVETEWEMPAKPSDARRTWPSREPEVEIDYLLYRPADQFEVLAHRVVEERTASDHRPVLLVLRVHHGSGSSK